MISETVKYRPTVNHELKEYVEGTILPQYNSMDAAHGISHINTVISAALKLACHYSVNVDILYAAAAYHDLGVKISRAEHHTESAKIVRGDTTLAKWFSGQEIELIAMAVEDHRASSGREPRGIYGKIIAEADRVIERDTIIRRSIQFNLAKYPDMNRGEAWVRCREHIIAKYAEGGYMKLWIPESDNGMELQRFRELISNEQEFRRAFDSIYREETLGKMVCERFLSDEHYRKGHINILSAPSGTVILGLHIPQMREIAKKLSKRDDWRSIIEDWEKTGSFSPLSHEERTIWGFILNMVKIPLEERLEYITPYLETIDNWALCDTFCSNSKWIDKIKGKPEESVVKKFIKGLLSSNREFIRRTGIILLLAHFLDDSNLSQTFGLIDSMDLKENEPYYVRMGVAWLLATALAKNTISTKNYIASSSLPRDIIKLYVRKSRESFRTRNIAPLHECNR